MTTALMYLGWTALITALMWIPQTLQMMQGQGLLKPFGNRDDVGPLAPWAERSKRAHGNAIENLAIFGVLVLAAYATGNINETVNTAALVYFWARVGHYAFYTGGIKYARTAAWVVGWICQLTVAWQIVG